MKQLDEKLVIVHFFMIFFMQTSLRFWKYTLRLHFTKMFII